MRFNEWSARVLTLIALCLVSFSFRLTSGIQEAPDGSVCFNNCNDHGDCIDYTCHCHPGYHGDDCSTAFVATGEKVVPILSAGHFNVTRKNFTSAVSKNKNILIGFSSYNCHKCIAVEPEYEKIADELKKIKVPFARADADQMKTIAIEHEASDVPSLIFFKKNRPIPFRGVQTADAVVAFVEKQIGKPVVQLKSQKDVEDFFASRNSSSKYSISTTMVVGFFSEHEDVEEDEYNELIEVAEELQSKEDIYIGIVTSPSVAKIYKSNKEIDRTPSVLLIGDDGTKKAVNLNELYGSSGGLKEWIIKNAIPLVGKLTAQNFRVYEKMTIPMLIMFLDLTHELASSRPGHIVGGKSGGILNEHLLEEFRIVAKEHSDRIAFVYADGTRHEDQMKSLGLYGGRERLPSIAFNTRENLQIPFPEELPINRDTLLQYCADFLSGKLRSAHDAAEMAKKALMAAKPINPKNKANRKERKTAPAEVTGISEQFGDGKLGDEAVTPVTLQTFDDIVMNEDKDVLLLLYARDCEPCAHFAVYFKRMAQRFQEITIPTLTIARMDITDESPPGDLNLLIGKLPLLVMLPAGEKHPPWNFYSGVGKGQQMMRWVQSKATFYFDLPNLPHLPEDKKDLYKQQVREREEALEKKRKEDDRAMKAEELAQKEVKRRRRKMEKEKGEKVDKEIGKDGDKRGVGDRAQGDADTGDSSSAGTTSASATSTPSTDDAEQSGNDIHAPSAVTATTATDQNRVKTGGGLKRKRGTNIADSSRSSSNSIGNSNNGDDDDNGKKKSRGVSSRRRARAAGGGGDSSGSGSGLDDHDEF